MMRRLWMGLVVAALVAGCGKENAKEEAPAPPERPEPAAQGGEEADDPAEPGASAGAGEASELGWLDGVWVVDIEETVAKERWTARGTPFDDHILTSEVEEDVWTPSALDHAMGDLALAFEGGQARGLVAGSGAVTRMVMTLNAVDAGSAELRHDGFVAKITREGDRLKVVDAGQTLWMRREPSLKVDWSLPLPQRPSAAGAPVRFCGALVPRDADEVECATPGADLSALSALMDLGNIDLDEAGVPDLGWLAALKTGTQVVSLWLDDGKFSDLLPIRVHTPNVQSLSLANTPVASLAPLADLDELRELYLDGTKVSDLTPLKGHTRLGTLGVGGTGVTDLSPLAGMTWLSALNLANTGVTELDALHDKQWLSLLNLEGTKVTRAELEALTKAWEGRSQRYEIEGCEGAGDLPCAESESDDDDDDE